jgi:hypothetical protein
MRAAAPGIGWAIGSRRRSRLQPYRSAARGHAWGGRSDTASPHEPLSRAGCGVTLT